MLTQLSIKNYALIDEIEVQFNSGLSIITGETGAGKSIIMDALDLLLGERADTKALKNKDEKCIIEAEFNIEDFDLENSFNAFEIDYAPITIIRREITPQGKSRSFINDTPVNLTALKEIGKELVDIHSQHQTLAIGKSVNQIALLDSFAGNFDLLQKYQSVFDSYIALRKERDELLEQEAKSKLDLDYFQFQLKELSEAKIVSGELEEKESELTIQNNSEHIKENLTHSIELILNDENGILAELKLVLSFCSKISSFHPDLEKINERIESVFIETKDIASELEVINDDINYDPDRIRELNDRINLLQGLLFKHRVQKIDDLLLLMDEIQKKIDAVEHIDQRIAQLTKNLESKHKEALALAKQLHQKREDAIPIFQKQIVSLLTQLSMPHAELNIVCSQIDELNAHGNSVVKFLISTNKGGDKNELTKIASGGEFARLMLAIKYSLCEKEKLSTLIFDEIDTGVSGEVAHQMGNMMRTMGKSMQVICITHLPQVAVKGNHHYKVYKITTKSKTSTLIKQLNQHERIEEIAKMLSGDKLSDAALANAKELMNT